MIQYLTKVFLLAVAAVSVEAAAENLQWPAGAKVCQGAWTYSEYEACEDASHGQDSNNPIWATKDGSQCGYEKKQNTCWHGREHNIHAFIETPTETLSRRETPWADAEFQTYCNQKAATYQLNPHQLLGTVSVKSAVRLNKCVNWGSGRGPCRLWQYDVAVQCTVNFDDQINSASDECGPYVDDISKPKSCIVAYHSFTKRTSACKSNTITTGRMTDATELARETWRYNFSCSTGDDLAADTREQAQTKYKFLTNRIQQTLDAKNADFNPLVNALSTLVSQRSNLLDPDQIKYATKITNSEIQNSKISDGVAFDVASECVSSGNGKSWFCPSKRLIFDFGDITHFANITPYTSVAHKLSYAFPCNIESKQLSARIIEGDDEFSLAPTSNSTIQSSSIVFKMGTRVPQIELMPDRNSFFPDTCQLNILSSSLDLDATLLLASSNSLVGKIKLIADFKSQLDSAAQLPAKYKTVQTLKDRISDQITEDTFKCQDIASSTGKEADTLCPLADDPGVACKASTTAQAGELGVVLDRIKQNSCLYVDLEQGLPKTTQCQATASDVLCVDGVKKVANLMEMEYQKARGAAKRLTDALAIEKARLTAKQADLNKKVGIVIDSLNRGLSETPGINSGSTGGTSPVTDPIVTPTQRRVIYDGENQLFSFGQGWDITQSTVADSTAAPFAGQHHLRFTINNQNWWGAAAYVWANFAPINLSGFHKLVFKAKSPQNAAAKVFLVSMETNSESTYLDYKLTSEYQTITIDLDRLKNDGFDLASPQAIVIATSTDGTVSNIIDIDNIEAIP